MALGHYQRAILDFSMAYKFDSGNAEHFNYAGQCHLELGQLEEALHHFKHAIDLNPLEGRYYYNRAHVKSRLERYHEAIEDYRKAQEHQSESHIYYTFYNRGICLRKLGMLEESIADLKQAVEMKSDNASAHNNLGLSYFEKGDFEEALVEYTKAINNEPAPLHYNNRGLAHLHIGKLVEAKKDFDEAINGNDKDPIYYFNRGNVFLDQGNFDEAQRDYDRAINLDPKNPKFWHSKGLAYEGRANRESMERAISMYKEALSISDTSLSSKFHLGLMFHKLNQFHEALQCFSAVLMKLSEDKNIYVNRGLVYQDMGNHQFAVADFNTALKLDPEFSEAYFHRGISELKSRRPKDAIDDFKKALDLEQSNDNPGIYDGLGCCYHALKDYEIALSYMDLAISKDGTNVSFLMNRSQCFFELGRYKESIEDLERALTIN